VLIHAACQAYKRELDALVDAQNRRVEGLEQTRRSLDEELQTLREQNALYHQRVSGNPWLRGNEACWQVLQAESKVALVQGRLDKLQTAYESDGKSPAPADVEGQQEMLLRQRELVRMLQQSHEVQREEAKTWSLSVWLRRS